MPRGGGAGGKGEQGDRQPVEGRGADETGATSPTSDGQVRKEAAAYGRGRWGGP